MNGILLLPLILAIGGYIFTTKIWISFLQKLDPLTGLLVYYSVIILLIIVLQNFGLVISNIKFEKLRHLIGSLLIYFSFFLLFDFASCYQNEVIYGTCTNFPHMFIQTEDGATYSIWKIFTNDIQTLRILTYVVTPFILTTIGIILIEGKIELSPF